MRLNPVFLLLITATVVTLIVPPAHGQENYELTEDSKAHVEVPAGEIKGPFVWKSNIFPETEREYWLYIPRQYDQTKPTCLMVVQDGLSRAQSWNLPVVLDNLIYKKEIPVMIGIFVKPGVVPAADTAFYPRYNRSFEYDALGDRYARFLLEELVPHVSKQYNLSKDPNDRSIAGSSSGAICAFNVAWERPDEFRRVFSSIGSYVGLRDGHEFPILIRKTEPKPIRVFLQDGDADLNIYSGDWWLSNLTMLSALSYAGYEVNHVWGKNGHESKHAAAILPDALRWLWKDYPTPVATHKGLPRRIELMIADSTWSQVDVSGHYVNQLATNERWEILFTDTVNQGIFKITGSTISTILKGKGNIQAIACGAGEKVFYHNRTARQISALLPDGKSEVMIKNVSCDYLTASRLGIYFSDTHAGRLGFYSFATGKTIFYTDVKNPTGLALSAEQSFLNVGDAHGPFTYSFKILKNGELTAAQPYVHHHVAYGKTSPGIKTLSTDGLNLLYACSDLGIQVSDQPGKVNFIFPSPDKKRPDAIALGGQSFSDLYIVCGGRLYKRRIMSFGVLPYGDPKKPPQPRL